jgi:hypothetical protein
MFACGFGCLQTLQTTAHPAILSKKSDSDVGQSQGRRGNNFARDMGSSSSSSSNGKCNGYSLTLLSEAVCSIRLG